MSVIKEYRNKRKLTQEQFAKLVNVSIPTVKRWEKKSHCPTLIQSSRICDTLRLPLKKLFDDYNK